MPATPAENASGTAAGGNVGQGVSLDQIMALVGAIAGAVQTTAQQVASVSAATQAFQTQLADGLKSLTENVNKLSVQGESDTGFTTRVTGVANPFDDQFRSAAARDQIGAGVQVFMGNMIAKADALMDEYLKYTAGVWTRSLDHFDERAKGLPPMAPRSATGPGTTGA